MVDLVGREKVLNLVERRGLEKTKVGTSMGKMLEELLTMGGKVLAFLSGMISTEGKVLPFLSFMISQNLVSHIDRADKIQHYFDVKHKKCERCILVQ